MTAFNNSLVAITSFSLKQHNETIKILTGNIKLIKVTLPTPKQDEIITVKSKVEVREVVLPTVSYMGIVSKVADRNSGAVLLPTCEVEFNKILDAHKPILEKYNYINTVNKHPDAILSSTRDYICESVLGLDFFGYEELRSVWKRYNRELSNIEMRLRVIMTS